MNIGPYAFPSALVLAPMAGVSDRPQRELCRRFGADLAVSEMITSKAEMWTSRKTRTRLDVAGESGLCVIQIAGAEPAQMADAARRAVAAGAAVVDINMGCPAKKVCNRQAGSALLEHEPLVRRILDSVVAAVTVPVTLKMRTGVHPQARNGVTIARIAEQAGVQALTVHGRTRACAFNGTAEYDTIAAIKAAVRIPVIANGDITDGARARAVLAHTGADGLMIGRAAQGNPWIFATLRAALDGMPAPVVDFAARRAVMLEHLHALHAHYGEEQGLRIARKHIGWYFAAAGLGTDARAAFNLLDTAGAQVDYLHALAPVATLDRAA